MTVVPPIVGEHYTGPRGARAKTYSIVRLNVEFNRLSNHSKPRPEQPRLEIAEYLYCPDSKNILTVN